MLATKQSIAENNQNHNQANHAKPATKGTIEYAIATQFKDKNCLGNRTSFVATNGNMKHLAASVKRGYSFTAATFTGNYRNQDNFIAAQLAVLDLDDLTAADYARLHALDELQSAALIYETPSHTDAAPRCRVVFVLPDIVHDLDEYRAILAAIVHHFEALGFIVDPASMTPTQPYYGSTDGRQWIKPAAILPAGLLDTWREAHTAAVLEASRTDAPTANYTPGDSANLSPELIAAVVQALGVDTSRVTGDGWTRQAVKCPIKNHKNDHHAPKFYWNMDSNTGYCHKCHSIGEFILLHDTARLLGIDPGDYYPKAIAYANAYLHTQLSDGNSTENAPVSGELPTFTPHVSVDMPFISDMPLSAYLDYAALIIKSALATGKTELIKRILAALEVKLGRRPRVLIINFLTGLAKNSRDRFADLGFELYSDYGGDTAQFIPSHDRLIISEDSIHKIAYAEQMRDFDLVVLDETTQAANHLYGGTLKGFKSPRAYRVLVEIMRNAGMIVALDAHMTDNTAWWVADQVNDKVCKIENTHRPDRGTLNLHEHHSTVLARAIVQMREQAEKPENARLPVIIPCAGRGDSEVAYKIITGMFGDDGIMRINGNTSHSTEAQTILRNINEELPKLRCLIATWSVGTGIDVQCKVAGVYAIMRNRPLTPTNMMQMIMRYRNAGERHAWVQNYFNTQTTDHRVAFTDITKPAQHTAKLSRFTDENLVALPAIQWEMAELQSRLKADANTQTNNLFGSFCTLARREGFTLDGHDGKNEPLTRVWSATKKEIAETWKQLVLTSPAIDPAGMDMHRQQGTITPAIRAGYHRWQIESCCGLDITSDIYDALHTKTKRAALARYTDLRQPLDALRKLDRQEAKNSVLLSNRQHHTAHVKLAIGVTSSIWNGDSWLPKDVIAARFMPTLEQHSEGFGALFPEENRSGLSDKMIPTLRRILSRFGMRLESKQERVNGDRVRFYRIDTESRAYEFWVALSKARRVMLDEEKAVLKPVNTLYKHVLRQQSALSRLTDELCGEITHTPPKKRAIAERVSA